MELDEWEEPPEEGNASLDQLIIGATKTPMVSRRSAESLPMSNLRCQKMNSRASRMSLSNSSELIVCSDIKRLSLGWLCACEEQLIT